MIVPVEISSRAKQIWWMKYPISVIIIQLRPPHSYLVLRKPLRRIVHIGVPGGYNILYASNIIMFLFLFTIDRE